MELIASGNTAEIFQHSDRLVCKLFHEGYPRMYVEHEFDNAGKVFRLGIKTPAAHEIVCIGGRYGIVYDQVVGDVLAMKLREENESEQDGWMTRFVDFHRALLGHEIDWGMDYRDFLRLFAADSEEILAVIDELDAGNCLLHGDFHPENVMVGEEGRLFLIDMMNVCRGPELYDVARTYFLLAGDRKLQTRYLELMGYEWEAVRPYLRVILMIRGNESNCF